MTTSRSCDLPVGARRQRARAAGAVLAAVLAAGLGLTACTGGGSSGPTSGTGSSPGAASGTDTAASPGASGASTGASAGASGTQSGGGAAGTGAQLMTRMASAIKAKQTASFTLQTTGAAKVKASGVMRYSGSTPQMRMTMTSASQTLKMIMLPDALYVSGVLPKTNAKSWVKITPNGTDPMSRSLGQVFSSLSADSDITRAAGAYGQVPVTKVGTKTVSGVQTTEYQFTVSGEQLLAALPAQQRSLVAGQLKGVTQKVQLYLDADSLPLRQVVTRMQAGKASGTVTMSYSHWGEPVSITAPPASTVVSASKLLGAAG